MPVTDTTYIEFWNVGAADAIPLGNDDGQHVQSSDCGLATFVTASSRFGIYGLASISL